MSPSAQPWRFIAIANDPESGILKGDVVIACAGRPTRVLRTLPVNTGLLLNLHLQDILVSIDGVVGTESDIVRAMEDASEPVASPGNALRVVR